MTRDSAEDPTIYKVVVNHEEQYSLWPADRENARGWQDAGKSGNVADHPKAGEIKFLRSNMFNRTLVELKEI